MVRISTSTIFLIAIVGPALHAASFSFENDVEELALREQSNELVYRRRHHLPKIHLPHIDGKKILDGLKKYGPKIGKAVFKLAKMILREDVEERHIAARDIDRAEDLYELIARSPKGTWKKLMKTVKKMKKYAKAGARLAQSLQGAMVAGGGSAEEIAARGPNPLEGEWASYELVERAFDELEVVNARELYVQLSVLERALVVVGYEIEDRGWDLDEFVEERDDYSVRDVASGTYLERRYGGFGLEDLD